MSEQNPEVLHSLVADYLDRLNAGEAIDYYAILAEHPEEGEEHGLPGNYHHLR